MALLKNTITYRRAERPNRQLPARDAITDKVEMDNLEVVAEFYDAGELPLAEMSDFWQALDFLGQQEVAFFLVDGLEALSDDVCVQHLLVAAIEALDAHVISVRNPKLGGDPVFSRFNGAFQLLHRSEDRARTAKLREARNNIRSRGGRCEGRKPYGYCADPKKAQAEQLTLQRMISLRAQGKSYRAIANVLDEEQYPTRSGRPWLAKTISNILQRQPTATK